MGQFAQLFKVVRSSHQLRCRAICTYCVKAKYKSFCSVARLLSGVISGVLFSPFCDQEFCNPTEFNFSQWERRFNSLPDSPADFYSNNSVNSLPHLIFLHLIPQIFYKINFIFLIPGKIPVTIVDIPSIRNRTGGDHGTGYLRQLLWFLSTQSEA